MTESKGEGFGVFEGIQRGARKIGSLVEEDHELPG